MDVKGQFQHFHEQFHVLGSIHGGVRRYEIQTSSAMARHGTSSHLVRRVSLWLQHISCQNAFPMASKCACGEVQTAAWCIRKTKNRKKLSSTHRESKSDDVWQSPSLFPPSLVSDVNLSRPVALQSKFFVETSRNSTRLLLQELSDECITICVTERSSLGVVFRGRPDLFLP